MGKIPLEDLQAIRSQIPVTEVVGDHLALKKTGASYKALCPFHQERTPSFNINPQTNLWHCFGCGESGDVIDFVQQIEGEGFRWAVQYLADRYSIPLHFTDDADDTPAPSQRRRIIDAHTLATRAFAYALRHDPDAQPARDLLAQRGFDLDAAINTFGCGYAPSSRSLIALLTSKGYSRDEIITAGLGVERNGHLKDVFTGRLVWTITNTFGKPIGFGARRISPDDPMTAKYVNTSETPAYKKSEVLYGLHLARKEITRTRQAIVVEGYTDVMAMHLAGFTNTVASCGTAFTSDHLHALRRLVGDAGEIVFAFDDDEAGHRAAQAAYREFNSSLRRLSALPNSDGLDPCDLRQTSGDDALAALLDQRTTLTQAVISHTLEQMPQNTPEDRAAALDAVLPYLEDISDPLLRHEYVTSVSATLRFDPALVESRLSPTPGTREVTAAPPDTAPHSGARARPDWIEKELLCILAQSEPLASYYLSVDPRLDDVCSKPASHTAIAIMRAALASHEGDLAGMSWPLHVERSCEDADDRRIIAALTAAPIPVETEDDAVAYAEELLLRLRKRNHQRMTDALKAEIKAASSPAEQSALLEKLITHQQNTPKELR